MSGSNNSILLRGSICSDKRPVSFIKENIQSIRNWFDGELVLCTWKNQYDLLSKEDNKNIDKIILLEDPGSGFVQAYNRQLISYREGLNNCSGDVVLVARTDLNIAKNSFLIWDTIPLKNNGRMKIFDKRVLIGNMMTINPDKTKPHNYFRTSDWMHLGQKKDLEKLCSVLPTSIQLYEEALRAKLVHGHSYNLIDNELGDPGTEQIWLISLIRQYLKVDIDLINYKKFELETAWDAILNNFCVKNTRSSLNVHNMNYAFQPEDLWCYLTEDDYNNKYTEVYGK